MENASQQSTTYPAPGRRRESPQKSQRRFVAFIPPVAVFLNTVIGVSIIMVVVPMLLGWSQQDTNSHLYVLGTLGQAYMTLPAIVLFWRDRQEDGGRPGNHTASVIIALGAAGILAAIRLAFVGRLMGGTFMGGVPAFGQSLQLASPWSIVSALLVLLTYGPAEAFWVIYLVDALDKAMGQTRSLLSLGVVVMSLFYGLPHIGNVFFFGWEAVPNALIMVFVGAGMGMMYKGTRSPTGPACFWTLANGTLI